MPTDGARELMLVEQPSMGEPAMLEGKEAPPPGVRVMAAVRWLILTLVIAAAATSCWSYFRATSVAAATVPAFYCPMHAHVTSDREGTCPICHMKLEPIPVERKGPSSHTAHMAASPMLRVPNRVSVTISPERLAAVGAAALPVIFGDIPGQGRIKATVAFPEDAIAVHPRVKGQIERIALRETGVRVRKGQELCAVFSPDLLHAQLELLNLRSSDDTAAIAAARQKVEVLGMTSGEIDQVLATSQPIRLLPVTAPVSGLVKTKNALLQGMPISPGTILYSIVDTSHVYLFADVPAIYLPFIGEGSLTSFFPSANPLLGIGVKVDFIDPMIDAGARAVRVRMVALDPRRPLEPGASGTVLFTASGRRSLVVSPPAVIESGATPYVFVEEGEGRFAPRPVTVGAEIEDHGSSRLEITSGLELGERVVVQGAFLIDSESALQASVREGNTP